MNPLDRLNQRQRQARLQAGLVPTKAEPVKPRLTKGLDHYQARVAEAVSAMAPLEAMSAERTAYKRKAALPEILPFVQAYQDKGETYPNMVAVQAMVWLFDVGDIEEALKLGLYLAKTKAQTMPKRFDRDLPTFLCDAVYDWAKAQLEAENPASPYLQELLAGIEDGQWDLHPAVHSKLLAMAAKHADRESDWQACFNYCEKAQRVNPKGAGVKTLKEKAKAELAKAGQ